MKDKYCSLHGVFYQSGTVIPVSQRFGPHVRIVNQINNAVAPIDAKGMTMLEGGGIYITDNYESKLEGDSVRKRGGSSRRNSEFSNWISNKFGSAKSSVESNIGQQINSEEDIGPAKPRSRKASATNQGIVGFLRRNSAQRSSVVPEASTSLPSDGLKDKQDGKHRPANWDADSPNASKDEDGLIIGKHSVRSRLEACKEMNRSESSCKDDESNSTTTTSESANPSLGRINSKKLKELRFDAASAIDSPNTTIRRNSNHDTVQKRAKSPLVVDTASAGNSSENVKHRTTSASAPDLSPRKTVGAGFGSGLITNNNLSPKDAQTPSPNGSRQGTFESQPTVEEEDEMSMQEFLGGGTAKKQPTGQLSLIDFLNSDPDTILGPKKANSNKANEVTASKRVLKRKTGYLLLVQGTETIKVYLNIEEGCVNINEVLPSTDDLGENRHKNTIEKVQLGQCLALPVESTPTTPKRPNNEEIYDFKIMHEVGTLHLQTTDSELMMTLISQINTANSNIAYAKGIGVPNEQKCTKEENFAIYRREVRQVYDKLQIRNLDEVIFDENLYKFNEMETEIMNVLSTEGQKSSNVKKTASISLQQSSSISPNTTPGGTTVIKVMDERESEKYSVRDSQSDLNVSLELPTSPTIPTKSNNPNKKSSSQQSTKLEPKATTGVLMKHLSKDELGEMVVKYDVSENGSLGKFSITAATIEKLVERLADENTPDESYIQTFLHTFRHYTTAPKILEMLQGRLLVIPPPDAVEEENQFVESWKMIVRIRAINVVIKWVAQLWNVDFVDKASKLSLIRFVNQIGECEIMDHPERTRIADFQLIEKSLKSLIVKLEENGPSKPTGLHVKLIEHARSTHTTISTSVSNKSEILEFTDVDPDVFAKMLTILEHSRLSTINPIEFMLFLWGDRNDPIVNSEISSLEDMIVEFNKLCYWVPTVICTQPDIKIRAKYIEKIIKVGKFCMNVKNYNTAFAIFSGLNVAAVTRLKNTWAMVDTKRIKQLQELELLFSPQMNYKSYRNMMDNVEQNECCVPILSVFLKDLTFMNDGNPKYFENNMVNFGKLRSLYSSVSTYLRSNTSKEYPYEPQNDVILFCQNLRSLKDKESALHKYSLICEPKSGEVSLATKWAEEAKKS